MDEEAISDYSGRKGHKVNLYDASNKAAYSLGRGGKMRRNRRGGAAWSFGEMLSYWRACPSSLCGRCSVTNKIALRRVLVSSSISQAPVIKDVAVQSSAGKFCLPSECRPCDWTGQKFHPDDVNRCTLTGLHVHSQFLTKQNSRLQPLFEILDDVNRAPDGKDYPILEGALSRKMNWTKSKIVAGSISPTKNALAVCAEVKHMLGLKTDYVGFVFSPRREIVGKVAQGKRKKQGWFEA